MHPTDLRARGFEGCSKMNTTDGVVNTGQPRRIHFSAFMQEHRQPRAQHPAPLCSQLQACPCPC